MTSQGKQTHKQNGIADEPSTAAPADGEDVGEEEEDEDFLCQVCFNGDVEDGNEIVLCDGCDVAVHQTCYGILEIPEEEWFCDVCRAKNVDKKGNPIKCVLCPTEGGALKETDDKRWCHMACALFHEETWIGGDLKMEPIMEVSAVAKTKFKFTCKLCNKREGAVIKCSVPRCMFRFHASCIFEHKLPHYHASAPEGPNQDVYRLKAFCPKHRDECPQDVVAPDPQAQRKSKKKGGGEGGASSSPLKQSDHLTNGVVPQQPSHAAFAPPGSACMVCFNNDMTAPIFQCSKCDVCVHQRCYGIHEVPEDTTTPWVCKACAHVEGSSKSSACDEKSAASGEEGKQSESALVRADDQKSRDSADDLVCCLCPCTNGPLKPTDDGRWAHLTCAIWIPEVAIGSPVTMEPITRIPTIVPNRWSLVCYLCNNPHGAPIQCTHGDCAVSFHPLCAHSNGLHMAIREAWLPNGTNGAKRRVYAMTAYCEKHKDSKFDPVEWHKTHQLRQRNFVKRTAGGSSNDRKHDGPPTASSSSSSNTSDSENDTSEAAVSGSDSGSGSGSEESDDEEYGRNVGRGSDGGRGKKAGYVGKDGVLSARVLTHNAQKRGDDPMRIIEDADAYEQPDTGGGGNTKKAGGGSSGGNSSSTQQQAAQDKSEAMSANLWENAAPYFAPLTQFHLDFLSPFDDPLDPSLASIPKVGVSVFDIDEHGFPSFLLTKPKLPLPTEEEEEEGADRDSMEIVEAQPPPSEEKGTALSIPAEHQASSAPPQASPLLSQTSSASSSEMRPPGTPASAQNSGKASQIAQTPSPLSGSTMGATPQPPTAAATADSQMATPAGHQSSRKKRSRSVDLLAALPYLEDGDFIEDDKANFLPRPAVWSEYAPVGVATGLWGHHEHNPNFDYAPYSTNPLLRADGGCICSACKRDRALRRACANDEVDQRKAKRQKISDVVAAFAPHDEAPSSVEGGKPSSSAPPRAGSALDPPGDTAAAADMQDDDDDNIRTASHTATDHTSSSGSGSSSQAKQSATAPSTAPSTATSVVTRCRRMKLKPPLVFVDTSATSATANEFPKSSAQSTFVSRSTKSDAEAAAVNINLRALDVGREIICEFRPNLERAKVFALEPAPTNENASNSKNDAKAAASSSPYAAATAAGAKSSNNADAPPVLKPGKMEVVDEDEDAGADADGDVAMAEAAASPASSDARSSNLKADRSALDLYAYRALLVDDREPHCQIEASLVALQADLRQLIVENNIRKRKLFDSILSNEPSIRDAQARGRIVEPFDAKINQSLEHDLSHVTHWSEIRHSMSRGYVDFDDEEANAAKKGGGSSSAPSSSSSKDDDANQSSTSLSTPKDGGKQKNLRRSSRHAQKSSSASGGGGGGGASARRLRGAGDESKDDEKKEDDDDEDDNGKKKDASSSSSSATKKDDEDDAATLRCAICFDVMRSELNPIVTCRHCHVAVHRYCYGIVNFVFEAPWSCEKCSLIVKHSKTRSFVSNFMGDCVVCPNRGGAFKKTQEGYLVHVVCALWHPSISIGNILKMSPIRGVPKSKADQRNLGLQCAVCGSDDGCFSPCAGHSASKHCNKWFHPLCAWYAGLAMRVDLNSSNKKAQDAESKDVRQRVLDSQLLMFPRLYCRECTPAANGGETRNFGAFSMRRKLLKKNEVDFLEQKFRSKGGAVAALKSSLAGLPPGVFGPAGAKGAASGAGGLIGADTDPANNEDRYERGKCAICFESWSDAASKNLLVQCDVCKIEVHQTCYGAHEIPTGDGAPWYCRRCEPNSELYDKDPDAKRTDLAAGGASDALPKNGGNGPPPVECCMCPRLGGAFKRTEDGRWCHVACAIWIPEVEFANRRAMEPIIRVDKVPTYRRNLRCYLCKRQKGACIQCSDSCQNNFHPLCGFHTNLFMKIIDDSKRGPTLLAFCDAHTPVVSTIRKTPDPYNKLLQLRSDLDRARTLLDMVRRREKQKKQLAAFQFTVFEVTKEEVLRRKRLKIERQKAEEAARATEEAKEAKLAAERGREREAAEAAAAAAAVVASSPMSSPSSSSSSRKRKAASTSSAARSRQSAASSSSSSRRSTSSSSSSSRRQLSRGGGVARTNVDLETKSTTSKATGGSSSGDLAVSETASDVQREREEDTPTAMDTADDGDEAAATPEKDVEAEGEEEELSKKPESKNSSKSRKSKKSTTEKTKSRSKAVKEEEERDDDDDMNDDSDADEDDASSVEEDDDDDDDDDEEYHDDEAAMSDEDDSEQNDKKEVIDVEDDTDDDDVVEVKKPESKASKKSSKSSKKSSKSSKSSKKTKKEKTRGKDDKKVIEVVTLDSDSKPSSPTSASSSSRTATAKPAAASSTSSRPSSTLLTGAARKRRAPSDSPQQSDDSSAEGKSSAVAAPGGGSEAARGRKRQRVQPPARGRRNRSRSPEPSTSPDITAAKLPPPVGSTSKSKAGGANPSAAAAAAAGANSETDSGTDQPSTKKAATSKKSSKSQPKDSSADPTPTTAANADAAKAPLSPARSSTSSTSSSGSGSAPRTNPSTLRFGAARTRKSKLPSEEASDAASSSSASASADRRHDDASEAKAAPGGGPPKGEAKKASGPSTRGDAKKADDKASSSSSSSSTSSTLKKGAGGTKKEKPAAKLKREHERRLKKAKFGLYQDTKECVWVVTDRIYECRVLQKRIKNPSRNSAQNPSGIEYLIHFHGWSKRHDTWTEEYEVMDSNPLDTPSS